MVETKETKIIMKEIEENIGEGIVGRALNRLEDLQADQANPQVDSILLY